MQENDFMSQSDRMAAPKDNGYIYILSNPVYPDCVKIGKTTRLPAYRAAELSSSTSVPKPFKVEWSRYIEYYLTDIEETIHEVLDERRVDKSREFFSLPVSEAIKKADDTINDYVSYKWGGIKYRKKQDARWGFFFDKLDIPFKYIEKPMKIVGEIEFMPDFWLEEQDCFIIVSPDFLQNDAGKLMAYCFAREKRKIIFQFWNCKLGVEFYEVYSPIIDSGWGYYMTPEGEFGDGMEFGVCEKCGSVHVGHLGFPDLGDRKYRQTSNNNCGCYMGEVADELFEAYEKVQRILGPYG